MLIIKECLNIRSRPVNPQDFTTGMWTYNSPTTTHCEPYCNINEDIFDTYSPTR